MKRVKTIFFVSCLLFTFLLSACINSNRVYIESEYMVVKSGSEMRVVGFSRYGKSFKELVIDGELKYFGHKTIKYNWDKINLDAANLLEKLYFPVGVEFFTQDSGELFKDINYVKKIIFQEANPDNFTVKNAKGDSNDLSNISVNGKIVVPNGSLQSYTDKFQGNFVEANITFYVDGKIYWSDHLDENANLNLIPQNPYKDNLKFLGWSLTEGGTIESNLKNIKYKNQDVSLYALFNN